jgi:hypothetical protein
MVLSTVVDILLARVEYVLLISCNKFVKKFTPLTLELMFVYFSPGQKLWPLAITLIFLASDGFYFIFLLANWYSSP